MAFVIYCFCTVILLFLIWRSWEDVLAPCAPDDSGIDYHDQLSTADPASPEAQPHCYDPAGGEIAP